jgi:hypothetical protein
MKTWLLLLVRCVVFALVTFVAAQASAHPLRTTAVAFDIAEQTIEAELQLPLDQLELALQRPLAARGAALIAEEGPSLGDYVKQHMKVTTRDGRAFALEIGATNIETVEGAPSLVVHVAMRPPVGAPTNMFALHYDAILHRVVPHKIFVSVRRDFDNGIFADAPKLVDVLAFQHEDVEIDQSHGSFWRGFRAVLSLGMRHIAEGTDHLLFLLVLLLPAPLLAARSRWVSPAPVGRSVKHVIAIVSAFTVGHSVTLVVAAQGLLRIPSRPVEVLIALSIVVSAVHAIRPLFAGREPLVAATFGLVHGLAFASVLSELGFGAKALVSSVLAFNLGIEAMQLVVIALVIPPLVLLSRSPVYARVRMWGAGFSGLAACGWVAERGWGVQNPFAWLVELAAENALALAGILAFAALYVTIRGSRARLRRFVSSLIALRGVPPLTRHDQDKDSAPLPP